MSPKCNKDVTKMSQRMWLHVVNFFEENNFYACLCVFVESENDPKFSIMPDFYDVISPKVLPKLDPFICIYVQV